MSPRQWGQYWRTLRHLKPVQFYGRMLHRLPHAAPAPQAPPPLRARTGSWLAPARREVSMRTADTFTFLGESRKLTDAAEWNRSSVDKLWLYNLHYFDDLNARESSARAAWHHDLIARWVVQNPAAKGNGWEPYPTSLRIVNWVKWALAGNDLGPQALESLAMQTRWLRRRLERHLLGNHLFANAKALVFAGSFFCGSEAERWRSNGLGILASELREQILPDGGHFERSTMYHALALEDLLDLINIQRCFDLEPPAGTNLPAVATTMRHWLESMCHPDGEISFFNDAALGIAPSTPELLAYCDRLGIESDAPRESLKWLPRSGYACARLGQAAVFFDIAPIGPDYLPGHAHADTLSFEMSIGSQRVFVNSGTSCYGLGAERLRQRGTRAHNTVVVNSLDSSEVWSGFRVGRRARPRDVSVVDAGDTIIVEASHDGYRWLPGRPIHQRRWRLRDRSMEVTDDIGTVGLEGQARFHLHPDIRVTADASDPSRGQLHLPQGPVVSWTVHQGTLSVEDSTYHPRFGAALPNCCLAVELDGGRCRVTFDWSEH